MRVDTRDMLSGAVIEAAIAVHQQVGPGMIESVYAACLRFELRKRGLSFASQVSIPVKYDGCDVGAALRLDLLVEDSLAVELKSVQSLAPIHVAQLITHLRLSGLRRGLLLNFNVVRLIDGVRRVVV